MIKIKKISLSYQEKKVIQNLSLDFAKGEFCALLGPNGAGKSTLLKALIGFHPVNEGKITIGNRELKHWQKAELAKQIAIIPQDFQLQFDYTVKELVLMGRFPYLGYWQNYSQQDKKVVDKVLQKLDLIRLQDELYSQLSGGERRRVSIARALVQETDILLMDEAFANLDINHQLEIMRLLSQINQEQNKLIILVSHNINLAAEYCKRIVMMKEGKLIADGTPEDVITNQTIRDLYEIDLTVIKNPVTGQPNLIYPGRNE
ncbi:MAG: heme ABC transporter ATP-binding protein [Candidatus Cloacimonas sp. 4484_143]|nr:MAG: heme ABC transporter ATP-binding protein [Candidatus Cloacimonas sp. 4484_143]RLC53023.1 MAG: heme ABC transporter ATP-binding protein [Candidatus Cloacimonadota bacterium]